MAGASGPTMTFSSKKKRSIWDDPYATEIIEIPIEQLHPNPFNPRLVFRDEDINELMESIRAEGGVLQDLSVAEVEPFLDYWRQRLADKQPEKLADLEEALGSVPPGDYVTLIGHNRKLALERAGEAAAPCKVTNSKIPRARLLGLPENMRRVALNPIEQALGFQGALLDGMTQAEIATQTGCKQPHISRRIKLLKLPAEVQQAVMDGLAVAEAEVLLDRLETSEHRLLAWKIMSEEGIKAALAATRVLAPATPTVPPCPLPSQQLQSPGDDSAANERQEDVRKAQRDKPPSKSRGSEAPTADVSKDLVTRHARYDEPTTDPATEAAQLRDRACRTLLATGAPSNPRETVRLLGPALVAAPGGSARRRAHGWLRTADQPVGPDLDMPAPFFEAVASSGDAKLITHVAFAVALATAEVLASDPNRTWGSSDRDYINHLKTTVNYQPTEWELSRLPGE